MLKCSKGAAANTALQYRRYDLYVYVIYMCSTGHVESRDGLYKHCVLSSIISPTLHSLVLSPDLL